MTSITAVAALLILVCSVSSTPDPFCIVPCRCTEDEPWRVDCSREDLSEVLPVDHWPVNVTHMDYSSNNVSKLEVEMTVNTLEHFDLSHNSISTIVQSAFGGLNKLKYLDLSYNIIEKFEDNAFYGIDGLQVLNISGNKIKLLPDGLFYNFYNLEELVLADNPLIHVDQTTFSRLINLRQLDLSNIGAYALAPNVFHSNEKLEVLDLSSNEFHSVPTDALRSARGLRHLKFSENPVDTLHKTSFLKMDSLVILELNFMDHLREVGDQTFKGLNKLSVLELKYNRQLGYIHHNAFEGLFNALRPVLNSVNLEQNALHTLANGTFECGRMKLLNLQRNPWICDCRIKWMKKCNIQQIYSVDLKCKGPGKLTNTLFADINDEDLSCDPMSSQMLMQELHHDRVMRSVSLGIGCTLLVALALGIAFIYKRKDIKYWWKSSKKGPGAVYYVRAHAQPRVV